MKTEPFNALEIEKRLALNLLMQPHSINRKRNEPSALFNAFCILIAGLMAGAVAWFVLP